MIKKFENFIDTIQFDKIKWSPNNQRLDFTSAEVNALKLFLKSYSFERRQDEEDSLVFTHYEKRTTFKIDKIAVAEESTTSVYYFVSMIKWREHTIRKFPTFKKVMLMIEKNK